jgi:cell division septation protein DedD
MASETHDEGFHEIQLTGKQLVFLFMAATVVSVVIFLCGVLVGRGVRLDQLANGTSQSAGDDQGPRISARPPESTPLPPAPNVRTAAPPPISDPTDEPRATPGRAPDPPPAAGAAEPPPPAGPASPVAGSNVAPPPTPQPIPPAITAAAPPPAPPTPAAPPATAKPAANRTAPPADDGWYVQVSALRVKSEADAVARRYAARGLNAFVTSPPGSTNVFRVRVGPYSTRREADAVAARFRKEERVDPWVTR